MADQRQLKLSPEHLNRYVSELAGRQNAREMDTEEQMAELVFAMEGKKLPYRQLIAENGLSSGARSYVDNRTIFDITWNRVK